MSVPCPSCRTPLEVESAPRGHGLARCPVEDCGARLVFTADRVPFDPTSGTFRLRTVEQARAEPDRIARPAFSEVLAARGGPAIVCGLLTGVVVAIVSGRVDPRIPFLIPFGIGAGISTIVYFAVLAALFARDRREIARTMRFLLERLDRSPPTIRLRVDKNT